MTQIRRLKKSPKCVTLWKISAICLNNANTKKTIEDDIQISPKLLQEAILKTKHLKTVTIIDIQKLLRVGYPKAAKLYELITNSKINEK